MIEYVQEQSTTFNELPFKFEAGSQNVEGAVALHAAIDYLEKIGMDKVEAHEEVLTKRCLEGMEKIPHIHIIGSKDPSEKTGVITFTIDASILMTQRRSSTALASPSVRVITAHSLLALI